MNDFALQRPRHLMAAGVISALVCIAVALHASHWKRGFVDDAFITFAYSDNVALGHGPVFYPGNEADGASSFLWMMLHALVRRGNGDPLMAARLMSLAGCFGVLFVASFAMLRMAGFAGAALALAAGGMLAADYAWAFWAASGMEATAYAAVGAVACFLAVGHSTRSVFLSAWLIGICALLRPEGIMLAPVAFVGLLGRRGMMRVMVGALVLLVLLVGPLLLWKWAYYGGPVANTVAAKGAFWTPASFRGGLEQVYDFLVADGAGRWLSIVALSAILLIGHGCRRCTAEGGAAGLSRLMGALAYLAFSVTLFTVAAGGDRQDSFRFLQPVALALALLVAMAACRVRGRIRVASLLIVLSMAGGSGARGLSKERFSALERTVSPKPRGWTGKIRPLLEQPMFAWPADVLREVASYTHEGDAILFGDVGFVTYASRCRTIDLYCLTDVDIAAFYGSHGQEREAAYETVVTKVLQMDPALCFFLYDTTTQRYLMELDSRLLEDHRLAGRYALRTAFPRDESRIGHVMHQYVRVDAALHEPAAMLARLDGMSRRFPRCTDFYLWALDLSTGDGIDPAFSRMLARARRSLPFWAEGILGPATPS